MFADLISLILSLVDKTPLEVATISSLLSGYIIHLVKTWKVGIDQSHDHSNSEYVVRESIIWGGLLFVLFFSSILFLANDLRVEQVFKIAGLFTICFGLAAFLFKFIDYYLSIAKKEWRLYFSKKKPSWIQEWLICLLIILLIVLIGNILIPNSFHYFHSILLIGLIKVVREIFPERFDKKSDDFLEPFRIATNIVFSLTLLFIAIILIVVVAQTVA